MHSGVWPQGYRLYPIRADAGSHAKGTPRRGKGALGRSVTRGTNFGSGISDRPQPANCKCQRHSYHHGETGKGHNGKERRQQSSPSGAGHRRLGANSYTYFLPQFA